jgi:hypothetical protein
MRSPAQSNSHKSGNLKGFLFFSPAFLMRKTLFSQFLRKVRRMYFNWVYPDYIEESIKNNRQGECNRCGACCELIYKCAFLGKDDDNLAFCRIYGELRPGACRTYPFDIVDHEIAEPCSYTVKK